VLPGTLEDRVIEALNDIWPQVDALLVMDQVSEENCGVVTERVREHLAKLGEANPDRFMLADSRERIGFFRRVSLKPNLRECYSAAEKLQRPLASPHLTVRAFADLVMRPVFCTNGEEGIMIANPSSVDSPAVLVPAYPVAGPIDIVGAGDSTSAGIASAVASGASLEEAAAFGNLVASITIQQIGTTGTASPEQVRQRWREVRGS
jgi:sugar/nucleoside kinase (ribokinase family)